MRALACLLITACATAAPTHEEKLAPLVHDEDRGVRYAAVMALGKAGTGEDALAQALRDPEWCVRAEAAVALARVGPRALPLVLEAARDNDREVRLESWTALRKMGPDAIRAGHDALRKGLASEDVEERLEAARCLVLLGDAENDTLLPVVLAALEEEKDPDLLCRAAWILRTIGPPGAKAAPMLEAWLADDKWKHYDAFREALAAIKPPVPPPEPKLTEADARAKLASDSLEAVLDGATGLETLGIDPRPLLAERDDENAAQVFVILGPGPTPPPERWLWNGCGEWAAIALGQRGLAADAIVGNDPRVRAAAVWSHGRAGIPVPDAMRDEDPVVREMAVRTLGPRELAAALLGDDVAIRRLAANRCAEERIFVAELLGAARAEDLDLRILATRALSRCGEPFLPALRDTSRAVRMEAVLGLTAGHEAQLLQALADEDWRIRRAALQRLGPSKRAAEAAAPFVADVNPLLSEAAAGALSRMGVVAAPPLARILPGASEAVHYHAPRIFAAIGKDGAAAVPTLVLLLNDPDVNARECAARCLAAIGPGARGASAELVNALGHPRLSVVGHAALALGRIGVTPELERALKDPRPRVRAYAAFAYGWACGDERGLDQVPFEVRLPVLDCGEAPPGKFAELRSKDPAVAIPCAAARRAEELDAWESERVMELLLCGGARPGAPGDFDNYRNVLGSAELPAQMQYLVRARRTDGGKERIFGENHRIARRENIPAFLWFERTEDADALNGVGGVYMPLDSSDEVSLFMPEERGRRGPGIPPALREWLEGSGDLELACALWWLEEVTPLESDAPLLLAFARRAFGPDGDEYSRAAALRALGRLTDPWSERLLREVEARGVPTNGQVDGSLERFATAALARRGDPGAIADLLGDSSFAQLLDATPGFAVARLRERLLDPEQALETCRLVRGELDESFFGARLDETLFAGMAEAAIASDLDSQVLARIAVTVPGCRRKALAETAFARLDRSRWPPDDHGRADLDAAAFLFSADPQRFVAAVRKWTDSQDEDARSVALEMLLRIGDPASAGTLVAALRDPEGAKRLFAHFGWEMNDFLARTRAPEVERFLIDADANEQSAESLFAYTGLRWLHPDGAAATLAAVRSGEAIPAMLRELDSAEERKIYPELGLVRDPRVLAWLRKERSARTYQLSDVLAALVLAGDRDAREELWSMIRCGRHRLLYSAFDERVFTLDWDLTTLPHWIEELDSNCCRVAGGLESLFEEKLDGAGLYYRPWRGLGEPRSYRARIELLRHGGRFVWSPLVDRFVAAPD